VAGHRQSDGIGAVAFQGQLGKAAGLLGIGLPVCRPSLHPREIGTTSRTTRKARRRADPWRWPRPRNSRALMNASREQTHRYSRRAQIEVVRLEVFAAA